MIEPGAGEAASPAFIAVATKRPDIDPAIVASSRTGFMRM